MNNDDNRSLRPSSTRQLVSWVVTVGLLGFVCFAVWFVRQFRFPGL